VYNKHRTETTTDLYKRLRSSVVDTYVLELFIRKVYPFTRQAHPAFIQRYDAIVRRIRPPLPLSIQYIHDISSAIIQTVLDILKTYAVHKQVIGQIVSLHDTIDYCLEALDAHDVIPPTANDPDLQKEIDDALVRIHSLIEPYPSPVLPEDEPEIHQSGDNIILAHSLWDAKMFAHIHHISFRNPVRIDSDSFFDQMGIAQDEYTIPFLPAYFNRNKKSSILDERLATLTRTAEGDNQAIKVLVHRGDIKQDA
jgi:hypothetical protein